MSPELRLQYLQAMGIQCWQNRLAEPLQTLPDIPTEHRVSIAETAPTSVNHAVAEPVMAAITETSDNINWKELSLKIAQCTACELHQFRVAPLPGEGAESARVMVLSLAPEVAGSTVQLLSDSAARLFDAMLKSIGLTRAQIYFTSLLKCSLPEQREPRTTEVVCCENYLQQQIDLVQPTVIISLGETCAQNLLVKRQPLQQMQQRFHQYHSVPVLTMNHPLDLLSQPLLKRQAWQDLLRIKQKLEN